MQINDSDRIEATFGFVSVASHKLIKTKSINLKPNMNELHRKDKTVHDQIYDVNGCSSET